MRFRIPMVVLMLALVAPAAALLHTGSAAPVAPTFSWWNAPSSLGGYNSAGEPGIGVNWKTGAVMFQSFTETYKIDIAPATPTWTNVGSPSSAYNVDPRLFPDPVTGRTFAGGLDGYCSVLSFTDNDGGQWIPASNSCAGAGWDHPTLGGGPAAPTATGATVGYPHVLYYCSQTGLQPGPAWCATSNNGGLSFNGGTYAWTTQCWGLHGHVKVGPDGYAYLPSRTCGNAQGGAYTSSNGVTWTPFKVPGIAPTEEFDPSVAVGGTAADNKVYFCARDGSGKAKVAVSSNHGSTWSTPVDVGAAAGLQNIEFPAMVAGDKDRAACAFLGTTTAGNTQSSSFPGVWRLYVATTFDAGATWHLADVTGTNPVQKGCIWAGGGGNACRNLLDFMDAAITKEGYVVVGFADGCTGACATGTSTAKSQWASIAVQRGGSPLYAQYDPN